MFNATPPSDLEKYIDVAQGVARLGGNFPVYKRILAKGVDLPAYTSLKEALAQGDMKNAELHAHTIKGVAGNLSLAALFELTTEYDALLKTGVNSPELEARLDEIFPKTNDYIKWVLENIQ